VRAWTIGHSNLSLETLHERLEAHGVERLADVRRYPASRRNPQFNRETLSVWLAARGVDYRWFEDLGGRRRGLPLEDSPNRGLTNDGFRRYADSMTDPTFLEALAALETWMAEAPTAVMCAEALWWRCHRRLLADLLVVRGWTVYHIHDPKILDEHELWDLARPASGGIEYPPEQTELGLGDR